MDINPKKLRWISATLKKLRDKFDTYFRDCTLRGDFMITQTHTFVWFFPAEKLPETDKDNIFFVVRDSDGTTHMMQGYFRSEDSMFAGKNHTNV